MADITREDLTGARFDHVDLTGARFDQVDLTGARFRNLFAERDLDVLASRG